MGGGSEGVINARPPHFDVVSVFKRFEMSDELRENVEEQTGALQIVRYVSALITLTVMATHIGYYDTAVVESYVP